MLLPPEYDATRARVRGSLTGLRAASASDQAQAVAAMILLIEREVHSQFVIVDGEPSLFTGFGRRLMPINQRDQRWITHMAMVYGLNARDNEVTPKITTLLASHCSWYGVKMAPRRWSAYLDGALHLSQYNGSVMRITGAGVTEDSQNRLVDDGWWRNATAASPEPIRFDIEDNGRHVLFADDDNGSVPVNPVVGRNGRLFRLLSGVNWTRQTTTQMRARHQVQALMIWMLAVAFSDLFPTKPILMAEGSPGSGKTTLLQMIQQALFGSIDPFTVSENGERDFWVALVTNPIMILDNTDELIKWLPDQICSYATKGYRVERKLHTNTGKVEIRPHAFIAVASKDPKSFRREDTADRTIVLRMDRRTGGDSINVITARIATERAMLYGEWLYYLNRTVAAIHMEPPRRTTARLGDFELFAYAACRALGWCSTLVVPELMEMLAQERSAFAAETDIVMDVISDWLTIPSNEGRPVTARDLFKELGNFAETNNKPFVRTPQALAQRLRAPHMRTLFDVRDTIHGDHKVYEIYKVAPPPVPEERN